MQSDSWWFFVNLFQNGNCKSSPSYQIPCSDNTAVHSVIYASCCILSYCGHPIISSAASVHPGFCQALQQPLCLSPCCPLLSIAMPEFLRCSGLAAVSTAHNTVGSCRLAPHMQARSPQFASGLCFLPHFLLIL